MRESLYASFRAKAYLFVDANNAINEVLSKLTALGTILVPMNLVRFAIKLLDEANFARTDHWSLGELIDRSRYQTDLILCLGHERASTRAECREPQVSPL